MFPTAEMKQALAYMNVKSADGVYTLNGDGHLTRRPLTASTKDEIDSTFQSGGGGLFSTAGDLSEVVSILLNDGVHPGTGTQILRKETVDAMFTNQIPTMPNFARQVRKYLIILARRSLGAVQTDMTFSILGHDSDEAMANQSNP